MTPMEQISAATLPTHDLQPDFVDTERVRSLTNRALTYIRAGYPVHFRGPCGTGKTTLALHIACVIGRPIVLIYGDDEFGSSELIGGRNGFKRKRMVDNFIHSVYKLEDSVSEQWVDSRLTTAIRRGYTLVYDEFTRSRPEANNVLLGILEERMLTLPPTNGDEGGYVRVHPNFTAIFTSNPEEYAGVHKSQDALRDRMITIDLDSFDAETEVAVTQTRSGLSRADAEKVVSLVRAYRDTGLYEYAPTLRSFIMLARIVGVSGARVASDDERFVQSCIDVLLSETGRLGAPTSLRARSHQEQAREAILELVRKICPPEDDLSEPEDSSLFDRPIEDLRSRFAAQSDAQTRSSLSVVQPTTSERLFYPRRK